MVDTGDLKSPGRKAVRVRAPSLVDKGGLLPIKKLHSRCLECSFFVPNQLLLFVYDVVLVYELGVGATREDLLPERLGSGVDLLEFVFAFLEG